MTTYCQFLRNQIADGLGAGERPLEGMKIAIDAGNGSGGFFATRVLKPLGADISGSQYLEPDGMFENHAPDCADKDAINAISLQTIGSGADMGLLFNADAGRFTAVDSCGREIVRNENVMKDVADNQAAKLVIKTAKRFREEKGAADES